MLTTLVCLYEVNLAEMSEDVDFLNISLDNLRVCSVKMELVPYSKLQNFSHKPNPCNVCSN
jgi:hypothetical protein